MSQAIIWNAINNIHHERPANWPPWELVKLHHVVRRWLATHQGINNGNGPAWRNDFLFIQQVQ
jgi:hypothetical protein